MAKFINPFTDVGFKRIFGQEINKDLLIDFLNALLEGERHVEDIHFLARNFFRNSKTTVVLFMTFTVQTRTASSLS